MAGDGGMRPGERVVAVADHLERRVPTIVTGHERSDAEQHEEKSFVEEHSIGSDRVHLHAPRLDTVRRPSGRVVVAPQVRRDEQPVEVGIRSALGVGTELREPVARRPPTGVALDQLVKDADVHLAPRRCRAGHEADRVAGVDQIEAMPRRHRRIAAIVPVRMGTAGAAPVVRRRRFAVDITQPAERTIAQLRTSARGHHGRGP